MSSQKHSLNAYTRATHTVAKTRQVVMLYDGAIRCLKQAAEAMGTGAIEERYNKLTRASEIISGLQNSLDFGAGGDTARVLYDFYSSVDARIHNQHRQPNAEHCQALVTELKEMRDVWDSIDRNNDIPPPSGGPASSETAAPTEIPTSVKVSA